MVTDNSQVESGEPQVVPYEDFRKYQSANDRKQAEADRRYNEERALNDDLAGQVDVLQKRLADLEARGYENDDPQVVALRKAEQTKDRQLQEAQRLLRQFTPRVVETKVENTVLKYSGGDSKLEAGIRKHLSSARNIAELERGIQQIADWHDASGSTTTKVRAPSREEVDTGRSSGGGSGRVTRAVYAQHLGDRDGGRQWRKDNAPAIAEWQANGSP